MKRIIGFSGTSGIVTRRQMNGLEEHVGSERMHEFHHGLCEGADTYAHWTVRSIWPECFIVGHMPLSRSKMIHSPCDLYMPPKKYLDRNRDIALVATELIALPGTEEEILRSGTWATVRYARKRKIPIYLILPSGEVVIEKGSR